MKTGITKILLIEDNPSDARLIDELFQDEKNEFKLIRVRRFSKGIVHLAEDKIELVLLDINSPESQGLDMLTRVQTHAPHVPVVVLTGYTDEALAMNAMRLGAQDYLTKDELDSQLLTRAIRYAVERKRGEEVQSMLFRVMKAANELDDLQEFLEIAHHHLGALVDVTNFYIALYDEETALYTFPFWAGEYDEDFSPQPLPKGLTDYVRRKGEPQLVNREKHQALMAQGEVKLKGIPAAIWLGVPLKTSRGCIGVVVVQNYTDSHAYTHKDLYLLALLAAGLASVIQRKQAEDALRQQTSRLEALQAVELELTAQLELDTLLEFVAARAVELLEGTVGGLYLYRAEKDVLEWVVATPSHPVPRGTILHRGEGLCGKVLDGGKTLIINDYQDWDGRAAAYENYRFAATIGVPVMWGNEFLGVLNVNGAADRIFTQADATLSGMFATQAAIAIRNVRLYDTAQRELTERIRVTTALRASEENLRIVLEQAPVGILTLDTQGCVTEANPEALKILGSPNKAATLGINTLTLPMLVEAGISDLYRLVLSTGATQTFETYYTSLWGKRSYMRSLIVPYNDEQGALKGAIHIIEDITNTKQHEREQKAIAAIAAALRIAQTKADIFPIIVDQIAGLIDVQGAVVIMRDPNNNESVCIQARGVWENWMDVRLFPGEGINGQVIATRQPYMDNDIQNNTLFARPDLLGGVSAIVCVPLIAQENTLGTLWAGRQDTFAGGDVRLLTAIADIAANALQRAALYEESQLRVQRLASLRAIDNAITASMDLKVTLNILLDQVTVQLGVDAASVLQFSPHTQTLQNYANRGFRGQTLSPGGIRLLDSNAGRVVLERRTISVPSLSEAAKRYPHDAVFARDGFVAYHGVPLVAKGEIQGVLEVFHRTHFNPETEWLNFLETVAGQAAIAIHSMTIFDNLQRSNLELELAYDTTLEGWARALELRDMGTEEHTRRVTEITVQLAQAMGMSREELVHVRRGALLHDIGKVGIPDNILLKAGPLTPEERKIIEKHPLYAYEMLLPISYLRPALDIPLYHHEKWDGSGYPHGLKGNQIPLAARVFAIIDVWDALNSDRPYRKAWSEDEISAYLRSNTGSHFDPEVAEAFFQLLATERSRR